MKVIPIASVCGRSLSAPEATVDFAAGGTVAADAWHLVGSVDAYFDGKDCHGVTIASVRVGLFRVDGEIYALDDICTHGNALLSEGFLDGHEIECPLHAGLVDIRTGKGTTSPIVRDTRRHDVRLDEGNLYVRLSH
ncbi:3-phenylpropionate/cinnamic acid dioxygenase ferredoxin subunit [Paraburkholderia domus]|jgi:Ferredoxin subunits of nitrite reductase and ring-hydroxylating dioxygenases|uniref:3-phenylpropionate/cinnamic acid dioxygenase ferredoxin subunit n=1 Tax=Paraburkholderia domus TaxID=2793075 RepID=A0A9N8MQU9_9BURK|nr:non-heme iron oxygenase ferredoxin subunit [Paraburkholderia domus]MBK5061600.1 non-heme iron oxygenase ferredoxin subunit [Burkholderia sp. R-70199]MBK5088325.1 non-heme iron oxygenase ferredoxin subunit [Burkholderia sp. R-69927]MBK5165410.1 non-heme iron oxygenase ferredoxin subunit [Burkholderia sp. R-70211]CAE6784283.1 3-phenylpropionate/cinnamic acid dioxygenase ferredoxin subunit [Paraburkholderia domus]CAE6878519.1 3-phenylpropionate/cinnamic acid dioxygenase ferredoxin subunit [Par